MKIIGLCGGSGSGKSEVSRIFSDFGIPAIDLDKVYHDITGRPSECLTDLTREFGVGILKTDGTLDRDALRSIVFCSDKSDEKLKRLNKISHYHVIVETEHILDEYRKSGIAAAIVDAPLLFESGFNKKCDVVIGVSADREIRISRIMHRDGITREAAELRISKQLSDDFIIKNVDIVIKNDHSLSELNKMIESIINTKIFYKENTNV